MASQTDIDANIKIIITSVLAAYKELTMKDFLDCVVKMMECAEAIPILIGADKKKVVKGVLSQIVTMINIPNEAEKNIILFLVNSGAVDFVIDNIVKLTKEGCKINMQQIMENVKGCKCCKCCIL